MAIEIENPEAKVDDWFIPRWVKLALTFFAFNIGTIFILSILSTQEALFGLSTEFIVAAAFGLVILLVTITVAFWFFPDHPLTLFLYWLMRFLRELICIFALLGIVTLLTIRIPLLSIRGGLPLINFILLFLIGLFVQPVKSDHFPLAWMQTFSTFWQKSLNKINTISTSKLSIVIALLPILIICAIIYFGLDARLADYGPYSFWNDETGYWVWIRSFSQVGFDVGYNAPNELIAQARFNHYGEGSPLYIYMYGAIAQVTGWFPSLPILINFVLLGFAILLFIRATKLDPVQMIFAGLVIVLTWPILFYLPMTTPETLHQAIGFILAIIFFKLLTHREEMSWWAKILFIFVVYLATLIRLSWGLLLVPVIFYSLSGSLFRRIFWSFLPGLGLFISAIMVTNYLVPPTNNSIFLNIKGSLLEGPQTLIQYIAFQFRLMFKFRQLNPNIAVMFQMMVILGWSMIRVARLIKARHSLAAILQSQSTFNIYNVASLAAAGLLFYIQEGFYRTFTPSLLIIYLLQVTKRDYRFLVTLLTINLVFFHSYMTFYARVGDPAIIRADFTTPFPERAQLQSEIERWVTFDDTADPWCNTLLIPLHYYDYRLTVIPPGIGISYIYDMDTFQTPVKSKYLLLDQETHEELASRLNATLLTSLSIGDLYYNRDSGCELKQ